MKQEYLFSKKGSAKLPIWNTVNLVEKQHFALGMPLPKLLGSKCIGKVEEGSAKLTEHVIKQYFLQFHLRSRQSKNIIAGTLDTEFKACPLL